MSFYDTGETPKKNIDVMREVIDELGKSIAEDVDVDDTTEKKKKKKKRKKVEGRKSFAIRSETST